MNSISGRTYDYFTRGEGRISSLTHHSDDFEVIQMTTMLFEK